ncbi:MAG TPA: sugar ABC transporter ATP-binding protein [Phycisphaerae bacterium]|nr:sugar ABC transporter ATP-binding protein [Phycisphaerae bacterium]
MGAGESSFGAGGGAGGGTAGRPLLEMRGITKSFGGVHALRGVDFAVYPGEIVCLLGENGAGKSTLMKILAGVHVVYDGEMFFDGKAVRFRSTQEAAELGIGIVYQEFNLCPNLSVAENLFLGHEIHNAVGLMDYPEMRRRARETFAALGVKIDPSALVQHLTVAPQQMIEIAKALGHNTRLLIMDEPTAPLAGAEIEHLFRIMGELKARGVAIVFISHKLNEVLRVTDRVVVLKDGENSGEIATKDATEDVLVSMMVGRELDRMYSRRKGSPGEEVVLEVRGLTGPPRIEDVSFQVRKGEIVGLAGLQGAGRTELAQLIIGYRRKVSGEVRLHGRRVNIRHPADAVRHHIGYVSEDRKKLGLILNMTVRENSTMAIHRRILNALGLISRAKEREVTDTYIRSLKTKVSSREQAVRNLSGGNQQKVAIAKWLAIKPDVLILDEPTRGIDVGAKAEVHRIIADLADAGVSVIMISSELPEVLHVADRILVMHEGRLTGEFSREEANEEVLMKAAVA